MTAVLAGGLAIGWAVAGRAAWRRAARLARLTAVAYAGAIVAAAPYLYYALRHNPGTLSRQRRLSLNLVRMILPWSDKVFGLNSLANYSGHVGRPGLDDYVGVPVLVVLLGLAVLTWRRPFTRLLVIGFAFVIALAVGPELVFGTSPPVRLPWAGLWSLPIARSAEPSRFIVFAVLALAIALALWLAMPRSAGCCSRPGGASGCSRSPRSCGTPHGLQRGQSRPARLPAAGDDAAGEPAPGVHH